MSSNPWKNAALLLATLVLTASSALTASAAAERTYDLGSKGEICNWLMLGYIPIPAGSDTWKVPSKPTCCKERAVRRLSCHPPAPRRWPVYRARRRH